jgi:hypothetical protein
VSGISGRTASPAGPTRADEWERSGQEALAGKALPFAALIHFHTRTWPMLSTLLLCSAAAAGQAPAPPPGHWPPAPYSTFAAQGQPAPAPMPASAGQPAPPAAANGTTNGNGNGNGCDACEKPEDKPETKYLMERLLEGTSFGQTLACRGIKVRGWTDMNYSFSEARRSNLPITFNDRADYFQMNQNWVEVQKDIDTSKKEMQLGGRFAWIAPGTDYRFTLPRGLWNDQLARGNEYGFDPVYHYADVFLPGIGPEGTIFRVGRFGTHCGYEVIDAVSTPFLTKSYLFQYNPFTHTGVNAITPLNDDWTVSNGFVTGSDVYIDPAAQLMYIGQIKWAPKDGDTTATLNAVVTRPRFLVGEAFAHYNFYNLVLTRKLTDKLTYVLDTGYSHIDDVPGIGSTNWYGFANYFLWQAADKLAGNLRLELFKDTDGFRTGFRGLYTAATYGLTWTPADALIFRPWVRYDYNADGSRPWDGQRDLFTGGIEAIVRW